MNAAEARALLFQRKLAELPVNVSLPDLAALDGQLSVIELSGADTTNARKLAMESDGTIDDMMAGAGMICASLVLRETKERILNMTDIQAVAGWGGTIITPLIELIGKVSGFAPKDVLNAKTDFLPVDANASNSYSVESLGGKVIANGAKA